jgi:serine protease Do
MHFDAQVVRQDPAVLAMADKFVFARLTRLNGIDLNVFRFDYDLTWVAFFADADLHVYARYGGRLPGDADGRLSREGLLHVMNEVLGLHQVRVAAKAPPPRLDPPRRPEDLPLLRDVTRQEPRFCCRCHLVNDALNAEARRQGQTDKERRKESFYAFPPPETLGVEPERVRGNRVRAVTPRSPADRAGLRPGDVLRTVNGQPVLTTFDIQAALNDFDDRGPLAVVVERDGKEVTCRLDLPPGWRRWDTSWRKSLHNVPPALGWNGEELDAADREKLKLPADGLAHRVFFVSPNTPADRAGLRSGDVIVAADGRRKLPYVNFRGYPALAHDPGDTIELIVLRGGKEVAVTLVWK